MPRWDRSGRIRTKEEEEEGDEEEEDGEMFLVGRCFMRERCFLNVDEICSNILIGLRSVD